MNLTVNETYTVITLGSTLLDSLSPSDTVNLKGQIACEGDYSYEVGQSDISDGTFTVDLDALFGVELENGVYSFTVEVVDAQSNRQEDYACLFVDKTVRCEVAECVKDNQDIALQLDYYILSQSWDCGCQCDDMCKIWKRVKYGLERCQGC